MAPNNGSYVCIWKIKGQIQWIWWCIELNNSRRHKEIPRAKCRGLARIPHRAHSKDLHVNVLLESGEGWQNEAAKRGNQAEERDKTGNRYVLYPVKLSSEKLFNWVSNTVSGGKKRENLYTRCSSHWAEHHQLEGHTLVLLSSRWTKRCLRIPQALMSMGQP